MKAAFFVAAALMLVAGIALSIPTTKVVERSQVIAAPYDAVRTQLSDFKSFSDWLPAKERVPQSSTYEENGNLWRYQTKEGRSYSVRFAWASPDHLELEMVDGAKAKQILSLTPEGTGTRVTWRHQVELVGLPKLAPVLFPPEKILGPILEDNLAALARKVAP